MGLKKSSKTIQERLGKTPPEDAPFIAAKEKVEQTKSVEKKPTVEIASKRNRVNLNSNKKERPIEIAMKIPFPAKGISRKFDEISKVADEYKAMGAILTLALKDYEENLLANQPAPAQPEYEIGNDSFRTVRTFNQEAYEVARKHFDPVDFLKPFAISNLIAKTALSAFFVKENCKSSTPNGQIGIVA